MATVNLAVTQRVLTVVGDGHESQRQIAIRNPSAEIQALMRGATAHNPVTLELGGRISLTVGDNGAVWRVHQTDQDRPDFDLLFELLARQPGLEMEFICEAT